MFFRRALIAAAMMTGMIAGFPAQAADLRIGFESPTTSMDPHFFTSPKNFMLNSHIFEPLVWRGDEGTVPEPRLAESWSLIDSKTWEFKLRKGVKWHDGSPFTVDDVIFTYGRAPNVPNSPTSFKTYTKFFDRLEAVDPYTLRIHTNVEAPGLLLDLSYLLIVSKKNGEGATTEDYNSGKAMVGTGPYKFVSYSPNDTTVIARNDDYWGTKEPWDKVTFRMMPVGAARVAALQAGDVDVIESVPNADLGRLDKDPNLTIWQKPSSRIAYYTFETGPEILSGGQLTDMQGTPLTTNPLGDKRVRDAMKLSVDLKQLNEKVMQNQGLVTGQYFMPGYLGYNDAVKPWSPDPVKARKLLEESGWADKFKMVLNTYVAAFQNSDQVAEALAQGWTKLGIPTSVSRTPYATFEKLRGERKIGPLIVTYSNASPAADGTFTSVLHSRENNFGALNVTRYSNKEFDGLVEQSLSMMDPDKRAATLAKATQIAVDDAIVVPLWLPLEATGTRNNLMFKARGDRFIYAMNVRPK